MRERPQINLTMVGLIYLGLFTVSVFVDTHYRLFQFPTSPDSLLQTHLKDILIGIFGAVPVIVGTKLAVRFLRSIRDLAAEFQQYIGPLRPQEIFFIAAFSAIGEEFFFRGFLQGQLGLVVASVIFALFHMGPSRRFWPWTVFALIVGLGLGFLYEWRANLLTPVAMHFTINYFNMRVMAKMKPPVAEESSDPTGSE